VLAVRSMALITLSGFPSSGKTRRAQQLKAFFDTRLSDPTYAGPALSVAVLSDDALSTPRSVYDGPLASSLPIASNLRSLSRQIVARRSLRGQRYSRLCSVSLGRIRFSSSTV
jgi:protein KTI12